MVRVRLGCLLSMDFEEMRTTSGPSLLSLRKLEVNQDLIPCKQAQREDGGEGGGGIGGNVELGVVFGQVQNPGEHRRRGGRDGM